MVRLIRPEMFSISQVNPIPLFSALHVEIHGLQGDFPRPREAVPTYLTATSEKSCREFLEHCLHLNATVFVDPAARFNVNLFSSPKSYFENVAEAMQPEDAFTRR